MLQQQQQQLGGALTSKQQQLAMSHVTQVKQKEKQPPPSLFLFSYFLCLQALSEAQQEVTRKERSLRILGKHLLSVQREKKQLEKRLQRAEEALNNQAK